MNPVVAWQAFSFRRIADAVASRPATISVVVAERGRAE